MISIIIIIIIFFYNYYYCLVNRAADPRNRALLLCTFDGAYTPDQGGAYGVYLRFIVNGVGADVFEEAARTKANDAYDAECAGLTRAVNAVVHLTHHLYKGRDEAIQR